MADGAAEFGRTAELIAVARPINYEGASGPMDFDSKRHRQNRLALWQVIEGAFSGRGDL